MLAQSIHVVGGTHMFCPVVVLDFIEAFSLKEKKEKRTQALVWAGLGSRGGPVARAAPSPPSAWPRLSRAPYLHV